MQNPQRRPLPRPRQRKKEPVYEEEEYTNTYVEDDDNPAHAALPAHGLRFALLAGLIASFAMTLINLLIPFLNVRAFQLAATQLNQMDYNTAFSVASLDCLSLFLEITICSFMGYIVGKYAVQRRLGFFAGFTAGVIFRLCTSVSAYIPNYPGNAATPIFTSPYILSLLGIALIYGFGGGLITLLVTWLTTRKHPYYTDLEDYYQE